MHAHTHKNTTWPYLLNEVWLVLRVADDVEHYPKAAKGGPWVEEALRNALWAVDKVKAEEQVRKVGGGAFSSVQQQVEHQPGPQVLTG